MIDWLSTPSDFEGDPKGFLANQAGHILLGAGLAWLFGPLPVLAVYVAWEAFHLTRGGALWDGVEDYGFIAVGVGAVTHDPFALLIAAPFLATGALRRGAGGDRA